MKLKFKTLDGVLLKVDGKEMDEDGFYDGIVWRGLPDFFGFANDKLPYVGYEFDAEQWTVTFEFKLECCLIFAKFDYDDLPREITDDLDAFEMNYLRNFNHFAYNQFMNIMVVDHIYHISQKLNFPHSYSAEIHKDLFTHISKCRDCCKKKWDYVWYL